MSAVEESKALVQRVASESDCSKGIFDTSEGSNNNDEGSCNNNDEGSCTESDSSLEDHNNYDEDSCSKSDDKKTELLEPSSCMFKCNFPKCRYTGDFSGKMESLVPCVRCLSPFHFSCQHVQYFFFDGVINHNFKDGTKLCHDCCLEFYNLRLQSKTDRPQRKSAFQRIYTVARRSVSLIPMFTLVLIVNHSTIVCYLIVMDMLTL